MCDSMSTYMLRERQGASVNGLGSSNNKEPAILTGECHWSWLGFMRQRELMSRIFRLLNGGNAFVALTPVRMFAMGVWGQLIVRGDQDP